MEDRVGFKDNVGSRVATILGFLCLVSSFSIMDPDGRYAGILTGLYMIGGSVAYRSARFRRLNLVTDSGIKHAVEIAGIILMFALIFAMNNGPDFTANHPTPLFAATWVLVAYLVVSFKTLRNGKPLKPTGITRLSDLWALKESGAITHEEYEVQKARILQ